MSDERHTCCATVRGDKIGWRYSYSACGKTAKVERDGKWYCAIHDPQRRKNKEAERRAAWEANWKSSQGLRQSLRASDPRHSFWLR